MILYFIRHGDASYSHDCLTELGQKQAEALSKRLGLIDFDKIYCSTSERAIQTAEPILKALNKKPVLIDWANEGYVWRELAVRNNVDGNLKWCFSQREFIDKFNSQEIRSLGLKWFEYEYFKKFDFSKGIERINKEVDLFLSSLGYEHDRVLNGYKVKENNIKNVAVFAHQAFGLVFLSSIMDIPFPFFSTHFDIECSSVTAIKFDAFGDVKNGIVYPKIVSLPVELQLY